MTTPETQLERLESSISFLLAHVERNYTTPYDRGLAFRVDHIRGEIGALRLTLEQLRRELLGSQLVASVADVQRHHGVQP